MKVLTWHVHGSYLYYLTQIPTCEFYIPYKEGRPEGYGGLTTNFTWGKNVHQIAAEDVRNVDIDVVIFQSPKNYQVDQYEILSQEQHKLPHIYLEHNTPRENPFKQQHIVHDPHMLLVHVTHFNNVMWDNGLTPTTVIWHGIPSPQVSYSGEKERGIVVLNSIEKRGRVAGYDIFQRVREKIPLDIVGIDADKVGGLGDIPMNELPDVVSQYRFFFYPVRHTSLGLALCEAMMIGLPIVALSATELPLVMTNGKEGYIHMDIEYLIEKMKLLLRDKEHAVQLGTSARETALRHFNMDRFVKDWEMVIHQHETFINTYTNRT